MKRRRRGREREIERDRDRERPRLKKKKKINVDAMDQCALPERIRYIWDFMLIDTLLEKTENIKILLLGDKGKL